MLDSKGVRIGLVCLLFVAQAALFPLYATQPVNERAGMLPNEEEIVENPDRYIGQRVEVTGIVETVAPLVVRVEAAGETHEITITDTSLNPAVGDKIRLTGTLRTPRTIRAANGFVVPERGRWYAWGISFLAGLWVLGRLIRHWTINRAMLGFEPRGAPLSLKDMGRTDGTEEGSRDA